MQIVENDHGQRSRRANSLGTDEQEQEHMYMVPNYINATQSDCNYHDLDIPFSKEAY